MLTKYLPFIAAIALGTGPIAAEAAPEDAERAASRARSELDVGRCDRGLSAAEDAYRADPEFIEAFLLKAAAYECAGDRAQAGAFLEAALEAGGPDVQALAASELARLDAIDKRARAMTTGAEPREGLTLGGDPAPLAARVGEAVTAGRCALARGTAEELRRLDDSSAEAWGLLGDAMRCAGRTRDAVLRYRGYASRGGDDAGRLEALEQLAGTLGVVEIRVLGASVEHPSVCRLFVGGELATPASHDPASATFADVPTGTNLHLEVEARMLKPVRQTVYPVRPGELRVVEVTPEYAGFARLRGAAYDAADVGTVTVKAGGETIELPPSVEKQVTAGSFDLVVEKDGARTTVERSVVVGQLLEVDPTPFRPATLVVSKVPAGAFVRVQISGADDTAIDLVADLPPHVGEIDTATGLRLAAPHRITGLIGGTAVVVVQHPRLGAWSGETVVEPGGEASLEVDVKSIPGVPGITASWLAWNARHRAAAKVRPRTAPIGPAVGAMLMFGGGAALAAFAVRQTETRARLALQCAVLESDGWAAADHTVRRDTCIAKVRAESLQTGLAIASGVSVGVGVGFVGVSISLGGPATPAAPDPGDWDPWSRDRAPSPSEKPNPASGLAGDEDEP